MGLTLLGPCCAVWGLVEDLPDSLRQMTELSSAAFETVDEAVDWWVAVRKRELEDEWRRTYAMRRELERSRIFQGVRRGLRYKRDGVQSQSAKGCASASQYDY